MLNRIAVQILDTPKPSINLSANIIINALITNKNKPKVKMVIGKVKIIRIGFTKTFKMAKTIATINGVVKELSNETPGKNFARMITAMAVSTNFIIVFISFYFSN
jgi:ABC-type branched-subunit amino acid transport system substrate-binding protein